MFPETNGWLGSADEYVVAYPGCVYDLLIDRYRIIHVGVNATI